YRQAEEVGMRPDPTRDLARTGPFQDAARAGKTGQVPADVEDCLIDAERAERRGQRGRLERKEAPVRQNAAHEGRALAFQETAGRDRRQAPVRKHLLQRHPPLPVRPQDDGSGGGRQALRRAQRSFSVARPMSARMSEMIQKRITICGSAQPFFSKWWWIGAIRKTRLPVRLK